MLRLIKMQLYRHTRKPWTLLVLVLIILLTGWQGASALRNVTSYDLFMKKYGDMQPYKVSVAVLDERRTDLTVAEIYDEYMDTQGPWLYAKAFDNFLVGLLLCMSVVTAAFFICRDISEDAVRPILMAGHSRTRLFIWIVLLYYIISMVITVVSMKLLRVAWQIDLNNFPRDYVLRTQSIFLLLTMGIMSIPMLFAFIFKNPIITAGVTFVVNLISVFVKPAAIAPYLPVQGLKLREEAWGMDAPPETLNTYAVGATVLIVVCLAASYLVFRRKEA